MLRGRNLRFVVCRGLWALGTTAARAADERAIVLDFTPTERAQIAIWIESADGTFLTRSA